MRVVSCSATVGLSTTRNLKLKLRSLKRSDFNASCQVREVSAWVAFFKLVSKLAAKTPKHIFHAPGELFSRRDMITLR